MKKIIISEKQLPVKLALTITIHSMAFALEIAGLCMLLWLSLTVGIILVAIPAALEIAWGTYLMILSAWTEKNTGYITTAGWMYICPFAQLVGAYFECRYYIDQIRNRKLMNARKKTLATKKED